MERMRCPEKAAENAICGRRLRFHVFREDPGPRNDVIRTYVRPRSSRSQFAAPPTGVVICAQQATAIA